MTERTRGGMDGSMRAAFSLPVTTGASPPGEGRTVKARTTTHDAKPDDPVAVRAKPGRDAQAAIQGRPRRRNGAPRNGEGGLENNIDTSRRREKPHDTGDEPVHTAADASGGNGDSSRDQAPPSHEEPEPKPFSNQWLSRVELTRGEAIREATEYAKAQAREVLGENFDIALWSTIMLPVNRYDIDGNHYYGTHSVHAQSMLRTERELARRWGVDGDSPELQYYVVKTFLTAEAERRERNGNNVTRYQMTDEEKDRLRTAAPEDRKQVREQVLTAAKRRPVTVFDEREEKVQVMAEKLREFADAHNIGEQRINALDAIAKVALLDTIVQDRRLTNILEVFAQDSHSGIELTEQQRNKGSQDTDGELIEETVPVRDVPDKQGEDLQDNPAEGIVPDQAIEATNELQALPHDTAGAGKNEVDEQEVFDQINGMQSAAAILDFFIGDRNKDELRELSEQSGISIDTLNTMKKQTHIPQDAVIVGLLQTLRGYSVDDSIVELTRIKARQERRLLRTVKNMGKDGHGAGRMIDIIRSTGQVPIQILLENVNRDAGKMPILDYEAPVQLFHLFKILNGDVTPTQRTVTRLMDALGYEGSPLADFVHHTALQELLAKRL